MGKRELVALLGWSSLCLVFGVWLFFTVPRVCLQFVIAVYPDHTILNFLLQPLGNFADMFHCKEKSKLRQIRDVCTL